MLFSHAKCSFLQYRIFDANDVAADFIFFFHAPFFALSFTACSNSSQILYANYISFSALNRCEPHTGGIIAFYVWYEGLWMEYFNSNSHFIYMKEIVILCCVQCFISFYTNWTQYKHQNIHWMQWLIFIRMKLSTISFQISLTLNSIRSVFFLNHRTVSWLFQTAQRWFIQFSLKLSKCMRNWWLIQNQEIPKTMNQMTMNSGND